MARDKLTVDLELNAAKARREVARLQKEIDKMGKGLSKSFGGGMGGGGDKVRALGSGLSKATVRADEFNKSLEASNARVIAFGASAGLIMQVDRALKAMVTSAIKVEKAMADVNVVMNASVKTLDQFGKGMFKVAKETAQGFDTVAEAATELARQGLGMEKTLSRTKDALILTRLTGMNAADAVKSLTAAVNSFNKEGVTSSQIVNRMAKVDAAFAVSSEDLAKAVSRVGSSAVDAGVSLNQLMAITTAVQQKTARGGAVIGNAFKTIFTRIQRTDVQKKLRDIGVVTTDMNGRLLDGVTILENLSRSFGTLSKAQQASVGESVAGVFQINILKAAMSDLVNVNSEYTKSLKIANQATNEAYVRNEQLNQTLDALVNKTLANLTQAGAALGGGALEPAIRKVLGTVNATIESFGEGGAMEGLGKKVGKGLLAGIGNFISGPGIILVTAAFGKLALNLGKFATSALKDFMGLTNTAKQRVALEEAVIRLIQSEPTYLDAVERGTLDVLKVEREIFEQIELNNLERAKASTYASAITTGLMAKGTKVGSKGGVYSGKGAFGRGRPGGAGGFVPNFADAGAERAAAAAGGYRAGGIRTMQQPGAGTVMYNSAETVKRFPGMSQSAIMPPQGSPAGAGYKSAFGAAHGFDPYAGSGFVPNFVVTKSQKSGGRRKSVKGDVTLRASNDMGVLLAEAGSSSPLRFTNKLSEIPKLKDAMRTSTTYKHLYSGNREGRFVGDDTKIRVKGMPVVSMFPMSDAEASSHADNQKPSTIKILQSSLNRYKNQVASKLWGLEGGGSLGDDFNVKRLSKGTAGDIFEEAVRSSLMDGDIDRNAAFDYSGGRYAPKQLIKYMRTEGAKKLLLGRSKIEAKIGKEAAVDGNIPKKVFNDAVGTGDKLGLTKNKILKEIQEQTGLKAALGFVPNFSPLTSAIGREMQAGVPASAIRVGSSPALRGAGNRGGLGVYNTIHEPGGLGQGISRSRASGVDPRRHGAASGFVPNFMISPEAAEKARLAKTEEKTAKTNVASGKKFKVSADKMMMASMVLNMAASGLAAGTGAGPRVQGGVNAVANIGSMAGMGFAVGGPWGAAAGAGLGALTSLGDLSMAFGEEGRKAEAEQIREQAKVISEALGNLKESIAGLGDLDYMSIEDRLKNYTKFQKQLLEIEGRVLEGGKETAGVRKAFYTDPSIKKLRTAGGATDLKAGDYSNISASLNKMSAMADSMTGGDTGEISRQMTKQLGLINLSRQGKPGEFQQTKLKEARQGALAMFPESLQEQMMTWSAKGRGGAAPTGKDSMLGYAKKMEAYNKSGDVKDLRGALKSAIPVLEGTGQDHIVKSFRQMLNQDDQTLGVLYNSPETWTAGHGGSFFREGMSAMHSLELMRKGEMAPMMMENMYGPQLSKGLNATSRLDKGQVSAMMRTAQEGLTTAGLDSRYGALSRTGARKRHFAGRAVDRVSAGKMAGITMAGDTLIEEQGRLQKEGAGDKARQARQLLTLKQRDKFIQAEIKLRSTLVGSIQDITMSYDAQAALLKKFEKDYADASQTEIESKLKALDAQQKKDDDLSSSQIAEVKYLEGLRKLREANSRETTHGISEINKSRKSEKENIDKSTAARISERKAMLEFQRAVRVQAITDAEVKTRNEAAGLRGLQGEGYGITNKEIADADKNARRARIRAGGAGDPGAAFREAFAYGDTDALLEFEDGVVSVANTMKSSFASAFQSISSGATTVGGAIAGMAQNILNSISQASSQMFTNMLFSRMGGGFSQGGLVPGYASGGVVTGGSGHQDDVLTRMQGGEFVIKKSAAQQIGYGTLNAINSYAGGGGVPQDNSNAAMGKMGAIAAGAGAVSGMIGAAMQPGAPKPLPMQDYGMGRGQYGFLGGADPDAGMGDSISGGRGKAQVSLGKGFAYYRRDPDTGELISERARPTEGRFEVSSRLSLLGRLGGDPQTSRMFGKEQKMASYQQYLADETKSRADQIQAVEDQKKARRIQAGVNAAMMIGGAYAMDKMQAAKLAEQQKYAGHPAATGNPPEGWAPPYDARLSDPNYTVSPYERGLGGGQSPTYRFRGGSSYQNAHAPMGNIFPTPGTNQTGLPDTTFQRLNPTTQQLINIGGGGGGANGGLARVMGGEYVMSPEAVRTYGTDFMTELNRGNVPGFANGGPVGGAAVGGGGGMGNTNNVRINVNIDKRGAAEVSAESKTEDPTARSQEADDNNEVLNNKEFAGVLEGVVLEQIIKQQRPGGLLSPSSH